MRNFETYSKNYQDIENYEKALADNFVGWDCHHILETHNSDGERRLVDISAAELKALDMYYNRPSSELLFMKHGEHSILHKKGRCLSEKHKKKLSEAKKEKYAGENNPMYGKKHSDETRRKMSDAKKNMSEETRKKISVGHKGKHYSEEHKKKISEAKKGKPKSEEHKKKLSKALKVMRWFNNGKINIRAKECPGGFIPGMLK